MTAVCADPRETIGAVSDKQWSRIEMDEHTAVTPLLSFVGSSLPTVKLFKLSCTFSRGPLSSCSSSLGSSGCSISRLLAVTSGTVSISFFTATGTSAAAGAGAGVGVAPGEGVDIGAGLGSSLGSSLTGAGAGEGVDEGAETWEGAGAGAEEVGVGTVSLEALTPPVSRSTTLGLTFLPANQSAAVWAGSTELAGGKILYYHMSIYFLDMFWFVFLGGREKGLLRLERLGLSGDDETQGLDASAGELVNTGNLMFLRVESSAREKGHTTFYN